ncbi:MAG: hypothetical protein GC190_19680 [Alphaproteobacteria bacterium]|nr:hypothetical protein [Alphaproteobacteria bacterium]
MVDLFAAKIGSAVLGVAVWYPIFRVAVSAVRAIKTGECRPNRSLPAVIKARQPIAYWLYVISSLTVVVPAMIALSAILLGAALGFIPIHG